MAYEVRALGYTMLTNDCLMEVEAKGGIFCWNKVVDEKIVNLAAGQLLPAGLALSRREDEQKVPLIERVKTVAKHTYDNLAAFEPAEEEQQQPVANNDNIPNKNLSELVVGLADSPPSFHHQIMLALAYQRNTAFAPFHLVSIAGTFYCSN